MIRDKLFIPWPKRFSDSYKSSGYWSGELLQSILGNRIKLNGSKVAIIDRGRKVTYLKLYEHAQFLAKGFLKYGLEKGDNVILHMPNCADFYKVFFALLMIGVKPVLALPLYRYKEISYFCRHVNAKAYITKESGVESEYHQIANQLKENGIVKSIIPISDFCDEELFQSTIESTELSEIDVISSIKIDSSDIAFFLLSGGTTGISKVIPRTHDDYYYSVCRSVEICCLSEKTIYLAVLPIAHNFTLSSPGALGVFCR